MIVRLQTNTHTMIEQGFTLMLHSMTSAEGVTQIFPVNAEEPTVHRMSKDRDVRYFCQLNVAQNLFLTNQNIIIITY